MSYILDALRKSERDRRQAEVIGLGELPSAPERAHRPAGLWVGVAVAVVVVGAMTGYFLWPRHQTAPPATAPTTDAAPAAAAASTPAPAEAKTETPPALKSAPFASTPTEPSARDLAQETRVEPPKPKTKPAAAAATRPEAVARAPVAAVPAPDPVKFLRGMPPEFQQALPELAVNIHIYSPLAAERILYINNRQYQAGDKIRDDVVVEDIVEDGAVLSYAGQRFKLPRPR